MSKTEETKAIENVLRNECRHKRIYGCGEVTIGFQKTGHGNEIVDYISMDSSGIFRCYEIKVSESDLKSGAKKSFYGHYNYLVVTDKLYDRIEAEKGWADYIQTSVGIISANINDSTACFTSKRKAKKQNLNQETELMLKDSMIRSLYWKMEKYRDSGDENKLSSLMSETQKLHKELSKTREKLIKAEIKEAEYRGLFRRVYGRKFDIENEIETLEKKLKDQQNSSIKPAYANDE